MTLSFMKSVLDIRPCCSNVFTPRKYCWHSTVFQTSVTHFPRRPGHILLREASNTHHCFFTDLWVKKFFAKQWYLRQKINIFLTKIESSGNTSMYCMWILQLPLSTNLEPGSHRILAIHSFLDCSFFEK